MKRIGLLLSTALLLAACAAPVSEPVRQTETVPQKTVTASPTEAPTQAPTAAPTETPTPAPTPEPTPEPTSTPTPEPPTEPATVRVHNAGAVKATLTLGETVHIVGADESFYTIETEDGTLLVERLFVRSTGEAVPKSYNAFARGKTEIFADPYLETEPITVLGTNTKLTVEDAFGALARVTLSDGRSGYTRLAGVSKTKISSGGSSGGQDGGDIQLGAFTRNDVTVQLGLLHDEAPFAAFDGVILAEGVEAYAWVYAYGDEARVSERSTVSAVYRDGETATLANDLLIFSDEAPYAEWDGFAKSKAPLYRQWRMLDEPEALKQNANLHIIGELRDRYIVEPDGGAIGYVPMDEVSRTKIVGSGGSGSAEWTDPVL